MHRFWNSVIRPAFEAFQPRSIVEIGCADGELTKELAAYCNNAEASLVAIDPLPRIDQSAFRRTYGEKIAIHKGRSLDILPALPCPDVVLIDGDHNWHTVYGELAALSALARSTDKFPVTFLHGVGWPYGERDLYHLPSDIPGDRIHPYAAGGLMQDEAEPRAGAGFNYEMFHAIMPGGERNGVVCAMRDFLAEKGAGIERRFLSGFHGLAILFPAELPKRNPMFRTFLDAVDVSPEIRGYLDVLEHERIHGLTDNSLVALERDAVQKDLARRLIELGEAHAIIRRMEGTRSWRITASLRSIQKNSRRIPDACLSFCTRLWISLGRPAPRVIRFVRHRLLGRFFPAAPNKAAALLRQRDAILIRAGGSPSVSVIVAARNNGTFLRETLTSILSQTVPPSDVIYSDDGSDDDSVRIARSMPGVRVLAREHAGVAAARNAGVAASSGSMLLFVDGDDILTPDYIATQVAALQAHPDAGFAYGRNQTFGTEISYFPAKEWDRNTLWIRNFVQTSTLFRRAVFDAVGGWRDTVGTMWDWDLALRASRIAPGIRCDSVLLYRRHSGSWGQSVRRRLSRKEHEALLGRARRFAARISVCSVISGRLPVLLPQWIDAIVRSVRAEPDPLEQPEFIAIIHNGTPAFIESVRVLASASGIFRSVTIIPHDESLSWTGEMERRHVVSMFLARAYNQLLASTDADIVWFIEDDVCVPEQAYGFLLRDVTDGILPAAAASGLYRNRHRDAWVAHTIGPDSIVTNAQPTGNRVQEVDLVGTGCLMVFRPFAPIPFSSHWSRQDPTHDWAWCEKVRSSGQKILLDPRVRCPHYIDATRFV